MNSTGLWLWLKCIVIKSLAFLKANWYGYTAYMTSKTSNLHRSPELRKNSPAYKAAQAKLNQKQAITGWIRQGHRCRKLISGWSQCRPLPNYRDWNTWFSWPMLARSYSDCRQNWGSTDRLDPEIAKGDLGDSLDHPVASAVLSQLVQAWFRKRGTDRYWCQIKVSVVMFDMLISIHED